jgi:hypothetical protein
MLGLGALAALLAGCGGSSATKTVTVSETHNVTVTATVTVTTPATATSETVPTKTSAPTTTAETTTTAGTSNADLLVPHALTGSIAHLRKGPAGRVSIVGTGPSSIPGLIPVVIYNGSDKPVARVKITATARKGGVLVATGEDQGLSPNFVAPGGYAIGHVFFSGGALPASSHVMFHVSSTALGDDDYETNRDMRPLESHIRKGSFSLELVGTLKNTNAKLVNGPIHVELVCLSKTGTVIGEADGFTDDDKAPPGATVAYSVDLSSDTKTCPDPLIAGGGFSF